MTSGTRRVTNFVTLNLGNISCTARVKILHFYDMASTTAELTTNNSNKHTKSPREWTVQEVRDLVQSTFGKRPCWYQVKAALALYSGKDVIGCAPTGAGKTLSFWIPLLMALKEGRDVMTIVVTPLNLLGKQNEEVLTRAGLPAIAVCKQNSSSGTWKVKTLTFSGMGHTKHLVCV